MYGAVPPAATTLISSSLSLGTGTGISCGFRTSGPPGAAMAMAVISRGSAVIRYSSRWIAARVNSLSALVEIVARYRRKQEHAQRGRLATLESRGQTAHDFISSRSRAMDLDDIRPIKKPEIVIGEDLALLSVAELEHRVHL